MQSRRLVLPAAVLWLALPATVAAQDRPFLFSVTTSGAESPGLNFHYDVGVGSRDFVFEANSGVEQRVGVQSSLGHGLTILGSAGFVMDDEETVHTGSQSIEGLVDVLQGIERKTRLAIGGGVLHEAGGTAVARMRVAGGRDFDSSLLQANLLFERPFAEDRDPIDLITSVGWLRRLTPAVMLGVEMLGEDLEGFWEEDEAEGGARLLVGPSLHVGGASRRWRFNIGGGPVFHATKSSRSSDAGRQLSGGDGTGYALTTSFGYLF
jgi:hypothetical protein